MRASKHGRKMQSWTEDLQKIQDSILGDTTPAHANSCDRGAVFQDGRRCLTISIMQPIRPPAVGRVGQ